MTQPVDSESRIARPLVLLVDDDRAVLDALESLLCPRLEPVYRVERAESAEDALSLAAPGKPGVPPDPVALVITDERMPGKSGTDLLIALKQHPAHRHAGRILITAYAGLESAKRAINEAEVDKYFPKPWDADSALLPAVAATLSRFARKTGMDSLLVARPAAGHADMERVIGLRRAWWESLALMDVGSAEGDEVPSFEDTADAGAEHILALRVSPRGEVPAGTMRLKRGSKPVDPWALDSLAFQPAEAGDRLETLIIRAALLTAASARIPRVTVEAPALRRDVYEAAGFKVSPGSAEDGPTVPMEIVPPAVPAFCKTKFEKEKRLCACEQTACESRDYSAAMRSYFCPLDVVEGRVPAGFPKDPAR